MIECLILGDSIAVGTHQFRPECAVMAKGGINSRDWNKNWKDAALDAKIVVISLGSNDYAGIRTREEIDALRARVHATHVFWVLPAIKPAVQEIVKTVAAKHNDTVIGIPKLSADGVHPSWSGYREIAAATQNKG